MIENQINKLKVFSFFFINSLIRTGWTKANKKVSKDRCIYYSAMKRTKLREQTDCDRQGGVGWDYKWQVIIKKGNQDTHHHRKV